MSHSYGEGMAAAQQLGEAMYWGAGAFIVIGIGCVVWRCCR